MKNNCYKYISRVAICNSLFLFAKMFKRKAKPTNREMRNYLLLFVLVLFNFNCGKCTMIGGPSLGDTFRQCLISPASGTLGHCLGIGALSKLQSLDSNPEFDLIDGITLARDQQEFRESYNFAERDPADFRSIVDSFGYVFSRRSMNWDMSFLYPGLGMRVAPSTSPGGTLEFVLDPHRESVTAHSLKEASTGRLIARSFLLPFLLGFKFNVATIIPILFGILALLAKKAVIISKLALIVSSAFGLGTLLLGNGNRFDTHQQYPHGSSQFNPSFGGHYNNRYPLEDEFQEIAYRGMSGAQQIADQFRLYGKINEAYDREDKSKGRNFAWNEDEKIKKPNAAVTR